MTIKRIILLAITATFAQATTIQQPAQTSRPTASNTGTTGAAPAITLNAVDATLQWWYSKTATQHVSTISVLYDENDQRIGWSLIAPTSSWDLSLAISTWACASTPANTPANSSVAQYTKCGYKPIRVAASTTGVFLDAYRLPPQTSGTDTTTLPNVAVSSTPSPSIAFPGVPTTISPGTPFVYFTAYEVVRTTCSAQLGGGTACSAIHETSRLSEPYVFGYSGPNLADVKDVDAVVTGTLDSAFPSFVQQVSAIAGTWTAQPTVVVVVVRVIVAVAVLAAHVEKPASSLDIPSYPNSPTSFTRLENVITETPEQTSKTQKATPTSIAAPTTSAHHDTTKPQGDIGSYIATGIGMPDPPSSTTAPAQTIGSTSPTQSNAQASSSSPAAYTPGNDASPSSSYSVEMMALGLGSMLFAFAYYG